MADYNERIFDYIILYDNPISITSYKDVVSDNINFSDKTQIFNRFIINNIDIFSFYTNIKCNISKFIKRSSNEKIIFSDNTKQRVDFKNILSEKIKFSDYTISHLKTTQYCNDILIIRTKSYCNVIYGPDTNIDNINFSDSVSAIISKHSERRFKNVVLNLLGTTEETIYTCNGKSTTIMNISICNKLLSDIKVDVSIFKAGVPTYIMKKILIKPHQAFVINNNDETNINLEKNDEIRVVSDTSGSSDVYMALMEQI